jgi:ANTAR domain
MSGEGLADIVSQLERENSQLRAALESRIVIEQAKGLLRERLDLEIDDAFALLRDAARTSRSNLHELASRVVTDPTTPNAVVVALARQARRRAVSTREQHAAGRRQQAAAVEDQMYTSS